MDGSTIIAIVVSIALAIALILLYKRQAIDGETLSGTAEMIQQLPIQDVNGIFGIILKYAATAVLTVEQLVKTGKISKDDASRKDTAMNIVQSAAAVDNVPFGAAESEIASYCIEAEVQKLPRNQPPDTAA